MYKNFNLTEEEKSQILEMHQSHGYKKSLKEQEDSEQMGEGTMVYLVAIEEDHGGPRMIKFDSAKVFREVSKAESYYEELDNEISKDSYGGDQAIMIKLPMM